MSDYIERREHEEFCKRMETEHATLHKQISDLEDTVRDIGNLATSVEKLACNMEYMLTEQKKQGCRLETLEGRDGEMWRKLIGYVISTIVGVVIGIITMKLGL